MIVSLQFNLSIYLQNIVENSFVCIEWSTGSEYACALDFSCILRRIIKCSVIIIIIMIF